MRGWRARIGIIYPADGLIDEEYWTLAPEGVSILLTRIAVPPDALSVETVAKVGETEQIEQAANALKIVRPSVIVYACTSGSFVKGPGWDREIADRIEKVSGIKATTTSTACVEGLKALKIRKVAVAAPYPEDINQTLRRFLTGNGFDVVSMKGLGMGYSWDEGNTPASLVFQHARSANTAEAEGVFIPDTAFPTIDILESLEKDLGKPVVSANQATMWKALAMADVREKMEGHGSLMRTIKI